MRTALYVRSVSGPRVQKKLCVHNRRMMLTSSPGSHLCCGPKSAGHFKSLHRCFLFLGLPSIVQDEASPLTVCTIRIGTVLRQEWGAFQWMRISHLQSIEVVFSTEINMMQVSTFKALLVTTMPNIDVPMQPQGRKVLSRLADTSFESSLANLEIRLREIFSTRHHGGDVDGFRGFCPSVVCTSNKSPTLISHRSVVNRYWTLITNCGSRLVSEPCLFSPSSSYAVSG